MDKKCYKCGSDNVVKVVPASSISIPEIKNDIIEGRAVASCCSAGTSSGGVYRCKDCNFQWDYYYERGIEQQEKENLTSKDVDNKKSINKRKWWKF